MVDVKRFKLRFVTDKKGKKTEVLMKVKDLEVLREDLYDKAVVAERRNEKTLSHEDLLKYLRQKG